MNFNDYIDASSSEKIVLAHIHAVARIYNFSIDGSLYSKHSPYFVTGIRQGVTGLDLTSVASKEEVTDASKFHYEIGTSKIYLFSYDNAIDEIIVTYRFFYANAPINLSWDLQDNSPQVEYQPRIDNSPSFKSTMAQGKKGISLIGSGTLRLINQDKGLNKIYDKLIWDNKEVKIYSYNRKLKPSEAKLIFVGFVSGKSFATTSVEFNVKDSIYALETKIPLKQYGNLTREADSLFFKRQIFGRVDNLLCQSINQVGEGYNITGTLKGNYKDTIITGTNTSFLQDLSPGDELIFEDFKVGVEEVLSNTQIRVSALEGSFENQQAKLNPEIHFRNKNRLLQVADHAIKKWSTTITEIISRNSIIVDSPEGFAAGDVISIDNESKTIRRISGNNIVLQTNYNLPHSIGSIVSKTEINNVRYGKNQLEIASSNVEIINNPTDGAQIRLSATAEYDVAKEKTLNAMFRFVNGRSKIWLGSPTFVDITCVGSTRTGNGPTDYSLMGKWFSVQDENSNEIGFWFKDQVADNQTSIAKPAAIATIQATNGGKVKSIELESRPYTAQEIATIVGGAISGNVGAWQFTQATNIVKLESIDTLDIDLGSMGSSGFSQNKTLAGVVSLSELNLTKSIQTRDFVKSLDQDFSSYLEVLAVEERCIILRSPYTGPSKLQNLNYKNVEYIQDDTPVYVNCYGKTKDGTISGDFISTAPEAVADILKQVGLADRIDTASFDSSIERSPYLLSLTLPVEYRKTTLPAAKEIINLINQSTLGSLHITNSLTLGYDILDVHTEANLRHITDADVISWSVNEDGFDLSATVISNYRHVDYDPQLEEENNKQHIYSSAMAKNYTQSTNTSENDIYFYETADAVEITERDQWINELSTSIVKIKGSINLSKFTIGERVILNFSGLFEAYGSTDNTQRIGVISSVSNNGEKVDIEVLDLGAIFNRGSRISEDDSPNYSSANPAQRVIPCYITEDNGIIDDDEDTAGTNLIS